MRLGVRQKLVLLSLVIVAVVSFGFTLVQLNLSRSWVEEDLRERALIFAREIAVTIATRQEFESGVLLEREIRQLMGVRRTVLQLDILAFTGDGVSVIATSEPSRRLIFTWKDSEQVRRGRVVDRLVTDERGHHREVMAPVIIDGAVVGGVGAKFSLQVAAEREHRTRMWALGLTAAAVLLMGSLMTAAVYLVVNRPIRRFMDAIHRMGTGETVALVPVTTGDEFGALANQFNSMIERMHELLFASQRRLGHAERLALAGRIMVEVAHEIGTPLHSVAGHVELLRQDLADGGDPARAIRRLEVIEGQLGRVSEIIRQLLDLTRRDQGKPGPVDLNQLVRDTVELVRPAAAAAGLGLHVDLDHALPWLHGHGNHLQQVVLNLLTNAMDATPPGGRIFVATRSRPDAGQVELEVRDTGHGIPAAQQKQIFEPFFSTKNAGEGTGLGLFISSQIAREHRGRIEVTSEEAHGSTFRVVLPADFRAP